MPRLALHIDPQASPRELSEIALRWEPLLQRTARPTYDSRTILPGFVAMNVVTGFFRNWPQPAVSVGDAIHVWLDGEIWDRKSACEAAGQPAGEEWTDPELCLRLYERFGDRFCEHLNGQFVVAVWDARQRRLLLCNDRHAFRPVFWRAEGGRFTCASEVKSIVAADGRAAEIDPSGVLELFSYGYQLADRTLFHGVQALLPGSRLVWQDGSVTLERYWVFRYPAVPSQASERDLVEQLAHVMRTACARQSGGPGRVGMALSAGLDSRMVAAALPPARERRAAYTTGYADSLDALGARQLANTYGMSHTHLIPKDDYMSLVGPEVVWRTEGAFPFVDATSLQFHDRIRPEMDIILTGHAGGALAGQTLLPLPGASPSDFDLEGYLWRRTLAMPVELLRDLFTPEVWSERWPEARRRFSGMVAELGDQRRCIGDAVISWNMERRQPRFTHHSGQSDRYDFEVRAPILDNDVVEFFRTVPYKYRFAQRLYKRTLAERFPEAARIPWSKTGRPVPGNPVTILGEFYLGGAYRKLSKRIPAIAHRRKDRVRTCNVIAEEMRRDHAFREWILEPFVAGPAFPDQILNREMARRLIDEHWSGEQNRWHQMACLATVALVYRHFVEGGLRVPECTAGPLGLAEAA